MAEPRPLRVGLFCVGWELGARGGVQVYVQDLVVALGKHDRSGTEFTLLVGCDDPEPPRPALRFSVARLPVAAAPARPTWRERLRKLRLLVPGLPSGRDAVARAIDGLGLDVVHYPSTTMPLGGRTPAIVTFWDMQEEFLPGFFSRRERWSRSARNRRAVAEARIVISPSEFTASCLRERYGTPGEKIRIAPPGIDERFQPEPEPGERERLDSRYGPLPVDFALYPAHPWPHKNHRRLFQAVRAASATIGGPIPVVCTGTLRGSSVRVRDIAAAAALPEGQVVDLGFIDHADLPAVYRAARVVVFPSLFEGFGLPVLEALACNRPVACARSTALRELARDAARTFDPLDIEAMASALALAWVDRRGTPEWRAGGAAATYRWNHAIGTLTDAYNAARVRTAAP